MNISGNKVIGEISALIDARLPSGWKKRSIGARPDFIFEIREPGGKASRLIIKVKASVEPRDVPFLKEQLEAYLRAAGPGNTPLIVSSFLSRSVRQRLKEAGISYPDSTGNLRIVSASPALYIETPGDDRNPNRNERPARSLKGAKAGRIVRALCDNIPPFSTRKLAESVGINAGYLSRVMGFLENEGVIERRKRGPITVVRWRQLIERWAGDYSFSGSNRVVSFLEPKDIAALPQKLASAVKHLAITGSAAAATVAPVAPTRLISAYVESPEVVAQKLGLRPAESGANVLLAEPYDPLVFERTRTVDGIPFAALSQVAVDLMTGPGRGPAEAQTLLDWMQKNESDWRN
ncbi:MAG: winged helix-turn-helix domain-containing protein [Elusimicrobiota bacterium]